MSVLAPGAVVGGCRIEGVVGRGGMGVVYLARQLELERDVALKVISPELTEDPLARGRFLAEARAAAAVEHPNVVPVHAVGTEDDRAYLVMRFIRGDDLRTLVRRDGPLAPRRAAEIAERLGDALDAIHRAGYVHRDVKPPNVLIDDDDHVYLSDFGLAKAALATRGPTSDDHWVGTLDYVAPEQIRGEPVDARTDVYALGGVLHFMLTGRPPFVHDADEAKLWAHLHEPPPRPSEFAPVPAGFDAVVTRALAKDPADRQASAGELGRAALAAARGEDVAAPTVTARRPRGRLRATVPWAWIAGLVFAAAGGALLALALAGDGDTPRAAAPTPTPTAEATPGPGDGERAPWFRAQDPYTNVGFRPDGVAIAGGDLWVISHDRTGIVWLDPETGKRKKADPIPFGASSIATDGRKIYVTSEARDLLVRLDARTGALDFEREMPGRPTRVAVGADGVWVATQEDPGEDAMLHRFDADGNGPLASIRVERGVAALTTGAGSLWVAVEERRRILRVRDDAAEDHAWLPVPANALTYARGRVWATVGNDTASRIVPRTTRTKNTDVPSRPGQIAVAGRKVLIALQTGDEVLVLDALRWVNGPRRRVRVPDNPYAMVADGADAWVTGMAADTLTRLVRTDR